MGSSLAARTGFGLDGPTVNANDVRLEVNAAFLSGASSTGSTGIAARAGVRPGLASPLLVTASSGMTVAVAAGHCWVQGSASATAGMYPVCLDTAGTITLATSDATNPRIDLIIARVVDNGDNTSTTTVERQTGTPAPSPVAPTPPANSLVLAQIAVAAGTSSIVAGNISDKRVATAAMGGIIPVKDSTDAPSSTAEFPAFRWRRDVTPTAGGTSPLEAAVGGSYQPIFDASVVPSTTTAAISAAYGRLPTYTSGARPGSPATGLEIWETDTGHIMLWNGSAWVQTYPVPTPSWTNMTVQSGWTGGTSGNTPQYLYNSSTGTVCLRGRITANSSTGAGNIVIATGLPSVTQAQYFSGMQLTTFVPISVSISGGSLSVVVPSTLASGDGVAFGGCYVAA